MKRKSAALRLGTSLLVAGMIVAQIPATSGVAFANGDYKSSWEKSGRTVTIVSVVLLAYGINSINKSKD